MRGHRAGIVRSLKSIKTDSQDGVSSRKIGRNSRGTGISDMSSQVSQTRVQVAKVIDQAEVPVSPSIPGDETSVEGRGGEASPSLLLTVEDLTNTKRDSLDHGNLFQNREINQNRQKNPIAVQLKKRSYVARGKEMRSHGTNPVSSDRHSDQRSF